MQSKDLAKRIALFSCVYYTLFTFIILFLYFALNTDLSKGMHPVALIAILPFSFCFASANALYRHTSFRKAIRLSLHFLLSVGGAMLFLYLPNKSPEQDLNDALLILLVLALLYWLVMGTILIVTARIRRVERETATYKSVYKKK